MIKKIIISTLIYYLLVFLFHYNYYGLDLLTNYYISNSLFVISLPAFFFSLIGLTNATQLFSAISYYFRKVASKIDSSYYDFYTQRQKKRDLSYWTIFFILSVANILLSIYIN
jgi:hypothetical protein